MQTLDYNLDANKNGGKVTGFNYSRSLNELVGNWSAEIANGTFKAGNYISFGNVLTNGFITKAYKDSYGVWHLEGKDAGIKLMKTMPEISSLPSGDVTKGQGKNAQDVIQYIANFCGIDFVMRDSGLSGFNVRSIISGSTCAEAVLELALLSGYIAYIGNDGKLYIEEASLTSPRLTNVINDSGSEVDLDGYATNVIVVLNRRKWKTNEEKGNPTEKYIGEQPRTSTSHESVSGSFGSVIGNHYSIRTIQPLDVADKIEITVQQDNITVTTTEEHEFETKHKTVWRDNGTQEYVLWAFAEKSYKLEKEIEGTYGLNTFTEKTTETMTREFGGSKEEDVSEDWENELYRVKKETITRTTTRTGAPQPKDYMPAYAPEYDSKIVRTYERHSRCLVCKEEETRYEMRQVGTISPVKDENNNLIPHFLLNSKLCIPTHSTPQWVPIKTNRVYYEQYDNEGNCLFSTKSEYCDEGAEWLLDNAISDTGDEELDEYQKSYAQFSQEAHGLDINVGSTVLSSPWQFMEVRGRTKYKYDDSIEILGDTSAWYVNGEYAKSKVCPHYYDKKCNAYYVLKDENGFSTITASCPRFHGTINWEYCNRAKKILEMLREKDDSQTEKITIGTASKGSSNVGYKREIYIDDILDNDNKAQNIADTIAQNILNVKGSKGIRKTVVIPYDDTLIPNGTIIEVSHDWANLQTTVSYLEAGTIPNFMISQTMSGIATFVSAREFAKHNIPKYGVIQSLDEDSNDGGKGFIHVNIDNSSISCTTKLTNLKVDDIVLVSFPSGNKLRGQVIARL